MDEFAVCTSAECKSTQIEPMSFVLHPPASLGPCSSSKAPKLSLPSWLPAPAPPALSVRQRRRALASGAAAIAGARHGGAVQASSVLATPIQAAAPAPYAGSYYDEYMGEDDFGWRQNFNDSFLCGKLLGQGSFGQVYLAVDLQTGREVAVKVMPKVRGKLSKDKTLEKLARECDILERLQGCPGIIQLEDVFEDAQNVMIVTEYCSGGDLQKFAEDHGGLDERSLAEVAYEVLRMLQACHSAGVLHGDIKPGNFCLKHRTRNPLASTDYAQHHRPGFAWLKAIDMGCSQLLPSGGRRLSKRTGTPVYMAPEIYSRDYHVEADIWSLGVMLYQLYSQRFPFWKNVEDCKASKLEEVAQAVSEAEISYAGPQWGAMSPEGLAFVQGCLTRNPSARLTVQQALNHPWIRRHITHLAGAQQPAAEAPLSAPALTAAEAPVVVSVSAAA